MQRRGVMARGAGMGSNPQTWRPVVVAAAALLSLGFGFPGRTPLGAAAIPSAGSARVEQKFTLLDPALALPPLEVLAPELALLARPPDAVDTPPSAVQWELDYRHAVLRDLSSADLRNDPSTGFSRQLDNDVLALGMSWHMAGSRVGLAYQLQSARGSLGTGLTRFLPGSEAATHALTLGVTREFGGGVAPPAPPPLLVIEPAARDETLAAPTPSPAS